jgi:hypothetical protein
MTDVFLSRHEGASPALQVARDLVKRGAYIAPVFLIAGAIGWGASGAASVAYALAIVCCNFLLAAFLIGYGARISAAMMGAAAMFGFLIRLGLIFLAVMLVKDASWMSLVPLGLTLIVTHLGLLFWEMRYVSASLAHPGLKPARPRK